ncbi:unnamed protein product [Microthlaspi erraticum]|uniref:Arabidopsis retrotransposon Orf1 C-terminal domain-containing protein n=1 Tax=Microthlaspi erraticum TaxID=1685480 RepID=A0A6D2IUB5_9BRAS|nr:unnamed protein product [Microthlaspi erraticum]
MRESSHRPLIFGTPFLSTVGAIFDFPNQRISFNKVNKGMFFPMCSTKNSFVDMVQEEKVTLKPPQEGETEETIKEDPIPKPKQLAKQARSKTKAPTPKPPKGSPRLKMRPSQEEGICAKGHSWRDCLSSCESPTRYSLQGEKTWRIKDASCLHLLLSAKPYSQAKDLKQALHGRQPMRIEGEKGVKTQSAPNHWPRTRKEIWPSNSNRADRPVEPGRNGYARPDFYRATKPSRGTNGRRTGRDRPDYVSERTDRTVDPGNKRSASAEISRPFADLADQIARPRQNPSAIGQTFLGQEHVESPRGEDDWALVSFVGEQIQDPRKCKKAMEKSVVSTQLTKEFLSTVALAFPNHNGDQPAGDGLLLFKIGDANGRISISALCQLFGLPNETAHDFKENSKRKQAAFADWTHFANEPFLPSRSKVSRITHPAIRYVHRLISTTFQCKQEANKVTTDEFYILTTPFIKHEYKANLGLLLAKTFINFCYEFPIGPTNTSLVLLPHEDIPSLRSGVVTFQPKEEDFYVPSSEKPSFPILTYRTLQRTVKAQRRHQERHVLTLAWPHQALDRVSKLEKIVECQSRFISRLVRVVRHIAPERLFRPSSTAREPYEPDLGEFSLDSELGSEGDDPIDEEESSSHCHT